MGSRVELHNELKKLTNNVYYQQPPNTGMIYPAIVYSRRKIDTLNANNNVYNINKSYLITVMDKSPDSAIIDKLLLMDKCKHDRHFISDGLNNDTFIIYY